MPKTDQVRHILRFLCGAFLYLYLISMGQAFALDPHQDIGQYGHEVWQTENGLPQSTVHAVTQTSDGYVWIATEEGLARFDGISFAVFDRQNTSELRSNEIRSLLADRQGDLWIATSDGLVRLSRNGAFASFSTENELPSNNIKSLYEDQSGAIWVVSAGGLSRFKDGAVRTFTTHDGLSSNDIETLTEDGEGSLWVGTARGLNRIQDGNVTGFSTDDGLVSNHITAICGDSGGALWVGTEEGLSLFKDRAFLSYTTKDGLANDHITSLHHDTHGRLWIGTVNGLAVLKNGEFSAYTSKEGLPNNRIGSIYEDREGAVWISTASGMARVVDNTLSSYTTREGLSSNTVLAIYEDREGSLWIGTESGGLDLLKEEKFTTFTARDGLSSDLVSSVYEDRAGQVWVGTHDGGLDLLRNGRISTYTTRDGLSSNIILAVSDDHAGNIWIGTPDGLNRLRDGRITVYTTADGLSDDFIRSIYADGEGSLWVGTRRGLTRIKDGKFIVYTTLDGLANDFVGAIYEDREGFLWVGTLGGLSRFKDEKFTNYTTREGLSSNVVISLQGDAEGNLWIGTNGGGLNRLKDGKFASYTTKSGLHDDVVYSILEDGHGNLWIGGHKGIFWVSKRELDAFASGSVNSINSVAYGTADGMMTRECSGGGHPSGWRTHDGRLWFATLKGVALIDPEKIRINEQPPLVVIERISIDDQSLTPSRVIDLPPGQIRFDFYYAGLSFVAPEKVRFRYRLEGFDKDWVDGGARRVAFYTNIPPGRYRFRVIACNNDGIWNETGAGFDLYIHPHFYQTYWFYLICAATLALLTWQLYRYRVRQIQAQFSAVLAERSRIAREIHDNLAQEIAAISVQLEIVARLMTVSREAALAHLDRARVIVRNSVAEARRYVWDLRSQALDDNDLPTALSEATRRLTADTPAQAQVQVNGTFRPLNKMVESNILRIGQEAVNNAVRHGEARHILITLSFDAKRVQLRVRDDGHGFSAQDHPNGQGGHYGLVSMRERAEQIGGTLDIRSSPGEGTEVIVEAPTGN